MPSSLLDFAAAAYDAGLDSSRWPTVLQHLNHRLGSDNAVLAFVGQRGALAGYHAHGTDPAHLDSYARHYRQLDPVARAVLSGPAARIWCDEMVQSKADLRRSQFHAEWCRPARMEHAMQAVPFQTAERQCGFLAVARPAGRRSFDDHDVRALAALLPHLGRAIAVHMRLSGALQAEACAQSMLERLSYGVFRADARGAVIGLNAAAEAMLGRHTGLRLRAGRLDAGVPAQGASLRRLLAEAAGPQPLAGWLALDRADGGARLHCLATPAGVETAERLGLGSIAALLLVDAGVAPAGRQAALGELFGLTRAEAAVAEAALASGGAEAIAASMGVAPSTVRTHLGRVFAKTGTRGQAELGIVVARLPALNPRADA